MRLIFTLLILLCASVLHGQIVNIPDANFKNALLNHDPVIDLNNDDEIQVSEAELAESLFIQSQNIQDLTGIEAFINLTQLLCTNNQISELDLSANSELSNLQCQVNELTSLDVSSNTKLGFLNCGSPNLSSLILPDISTQIAVYCANAQLSEIDVSQLPGLVILALSGNNIESLDVSQNGNLTEVYVDDNDLISINLNGASNLTRLQINDNPIEQVDISNNLELNTVVFSSTNLTEMDFSNHPDLLGVFGEDTLLELLNLKNGNNQILNNVDVTDSPNLRCIQVDNEDDANNGIGAYGNWMKDATAIYSEDCSLGIDENPANVSHIDLIPNPTQGLLHIQTNLWDELKEIEIFDLQGRKVHTTKMVPELDISSFRNGVYLMKFKMGDRLITKKIIKN